MKNSLTIWIMAISLGFQAISAAQNASLTSSAKSDARAQRVATETKLGSIAGLDLEPDEEPLYLQHWISPNGKHFARFTDRGISIDGKEREYVGGVLPNSFVFSPDGQRNAYVAPSDTGEILVVDGKDLAHAQTIRLPIRFSPDSRHVAAIGVLDNGGQTSNVLFIDGQPTQAVEDKLEEFAFSSDSLRVLFPVTESDKSFVREQPIDLSKKGTDHAHGLARPSRNFVYGPKGVLGYFALHADRQVSFIFEGKDDGLLFSHIEPESISFSDDGKQFAYRGEKIKTMTVVHNGKPGIEHQTFQDGTIRSDSVRISPDGKRVAYILDQKGKFVVFIDGKPSASYEAVETPEFSANSQHVAFMALKGPSPVMVIDGKESPQFAMVGMPEYSLHGQTIAHYAELDGKQFMIVNGERHPSYEMVYSPKVSADGTKVAYSISDKGRERVIINEKPQKAYEVAGLVNFYTGTNQIVYLASEKEKFMLVDEAGKETKPYDAIDTSIAFSPASKRLAFVATRGDKQFVVIDGIDGDSYDRILLQGIDTIRFTGESEMHYLAVRNNELFLVHETIQ